MEEKVTCPEGLEAIIRALGEIMAENVGKLTMTVMLSTEAWEKGYPYVVVYIHDKSEANENTVCKNFVYNPTYGKKELQESNEDTWDKMLEYIEEVKQ